MILIVRIVQHAVEIDFIDLGDGADIARQQFIDLDTVLALQLVEVADLERPLAIANKELHVLLQRALMHAEDANLAHVGVGNDLEDVGQHMLAGIRHGLEGLGLVARLTLVERRRVAFGRIGGQRRQHMQQFLDTGTGLGRDEQDRDQVAFAQRLFERRMQGRSTGVGAIFQVLGEQVLVFLDDLVDQRPVGGGDGFEIGLAGIMFQHFDDIGGTVGRQVEQHALLAEAFANVGDQAGQVEVVGIDLVDDDHPAQLALGGVAHHALGHQFDAGLGIDHDQCGIDPGQRGNRRTGEIRIARGVDQVDAGLFVAEIDDGGIQGVASFLLLDIEIGDGAAFFDTALGRDGAGGVKQRFGQAGLSCGTMTNQCNGTKGLGIVFGHLLLPELIGNYLKIILRPPPCDRRSVDRPGKEWPRRSAGAANRPAIAGRDV